MGKEEIKQISVRFPTVLYERINAEAIEGDRSFNAQVIRVLKEYYHQQDIKKSKEEKR